MGPDPFNMPSFGSAQNYSGMLQQEVGQAAPLATSWSGPLAGPNISQVYNQVKAPSSSGGALSQFGHFLGGTVSQIGHIASGAASWLGKQTETGVKAVGEFGFDAATGAYRTFEEGHQESQLDAKQSNLTNLYKSGSISSKQFQVGIKDLLNQRNSLTSNIKVTQQRLGASQTEGIDTAATLVTLATAGIGAAPADAAEVVATKFLTNAGSDSFFSAAESAINKAASDPAVFEGLTSSAQKAVQVAAADVVSQSSGQTAAQLARATAMNLAFKYPVYFNYLSTTGKQLYTELDQKKYGNAVRTLAFNAALMLSGGPIGKALEATGGVAKAVGGAMFGEGSFIDQLSQGIGNGDPGGLVSAVQKLPEEDQADVVKQLSAVEATNMSAVGKDPAAAAVRVLKGMEGYEGVSMTQFTHEEALNNMVNFAKAQRLSSDTAKSLGMGDVTVGRVDARDLNEISATLSPISETEVSAPGTPVFHGTDANLQDITDLKSGKDAVGDNGKNLLYVTHNKDIAKNFGNNVLEGRLSGKALDTSTLGDPHDPNKLVVPEEFSDYKTNPILSGRDRMVFEQSYLKGDVRNYVVDMRPGINDYLKSKGYSAVTIPRTNSDVSGARTETIVFDHSALKSSKVSQSITETRTQTWEKLKSQNPKSAWANNGNFDRQIKSLINKYDNSAELDNAIRGIKASFRVDGFPSDVEKQLSKMGYIPITPVNLEAPFTEGTGKLVTQHAGNSDFFTHAVEPLPILSFMGDALTSVGLSPNASTARVYQIFNDNLATNLKEVGVQTDITGESAEQSTDTLIKKLSDYAHNPTAGKLMSKTPITDLRMLSTKDISTALDVTRSQARSVQDAIAQSYLQVPLAIRGLGDKAVDLLYKGGPIASAERTYTRIQGAARFAYNPFFQYMRVAPKTEILASFEGGGFVKSIFNGEASEINSIRSTLREGGFLEKSGSLRDGDVVSGEASDFTGTSNNLNKKLLPMQERSIAGLISSEASRVGVDAKTYIQQFPQEVRDTIQAIAQYDKHSNFLNSPLARTMNVAFFPFRFEAKVAGVMARSLGKTSLMTQVAVVNGMMRAHQWLNTPEGMAWYSRNSQAIGFFEYITPTAELNQVFESLLPGHDHSLGNFGELGGLPFGFIPQLLDAEGLTHFNQPAVNAANGQIYSQYIPATTKGQMAIAIQDFLGTLYSYPGAEAGGPSKTSLDRGVALGLTGSNKQTDLQLNTPPASSLSMQQQNFVQAIQTANPASQPPPQNPKQTGQPDIPQPNQTTPGVNVPAQPSPAQTTAGKQSSSSSSKKKKGEFIPSLLPGQSQLGQL